MPAGIIFFEVQLIRWGCVQTHWKISKKARIKGYGSFECFILQVGSVTNVYCLCK